MISYADTEYIYIYTDGFHQCLCWPKKNKWVSWIYTLHKITKKNVEWFKLFIKRNLKT